MAAFSIRLSPHDFKRLYFQYVTRLSLTWYAGVATVSASDHELFRRIRLRGSRLIDNGVDISSYLNAASKSPKKGLLCLGRLSSNKRLDRVVRFFESLHRLDPEWRLCIAGRPWDVSILELRSLAGRLGVSDAIKFLDMPSSDEIRATMAGCSAFISASEYEGFGLTAVEALSAGLWPVLSEIPPFRHLVASAGVGLNVDFDDSDLAALQFLAEWAQVAENHAAVRSRCIKAAEAYHWGRVGEKYESLYRSALGQDVRTILDVPVVVKTSAQAVDLLDRSFQAGTPTAIVFANAHTLNTTVADPSVRSALDRSIVFNDGIGVDIASRLLFGQSFPENLNGTDFVPRYLRLTRNRYRIFLYGGKPGVSERAAGRLAITMSRHEIVGCSDGYLSSKLTSELIARIRQSRANVLLVAMGNPLQEAWLSEHLKDTGCRLGFGVGGLFDFLAGTVPRAPLWMQSARIEWAFRMFQEPRRLWRRYLLEMPVFLGRVARQWLAGARVPRESPQ